jgi:hypothetical protein
MATISVENKLKSEYKQETRCCDQRFCPMKPRKIYLYNRDKTSCPIWVCNMEEYNKTR